MAAVWVAFHLTDRCQRDCRHCLRDPGRAPLDLEPALVDRVLGQAVAAYGCRHVSLTGGEPLLHPRLAEVLDLVVRHGATWHVVTSGARFGHLVALLEEDPRRREALVAVDLSLDGADEGTHDAIRGAGSYREVMAAVAACSALGIPFNLQLAVNALNAAGLEAFGLAASQLGAKQVAFTPTMATGTPRDPELFLSPAAWRAVRDRIERLREVLRTPVSLAEGFPTAHRFHVCVPQRSQILHVTVRGELSLCCQLSGTPGPDSDVVADLHEVDLVEGHRRLLALIQQAQARRLAALAGPPGPWDLFHCNGCLAGFGKPHWTEGGSAGPVALRARLGGTAGEA